MPLHLSSKDFEILDLDPPNNPTSHYGACHFGYSLALKDINGSTLDVFVFFTRFIPFAKCLVKSFLKILLILKKGLKYSEKGKTTGYPLRFRYLSNSREP